VAEGGDCQRVIHDIIGGPKEVETIWCRGKGDDNGGSGIEEVGGF